MFRKFWTDFIVALRLVVHIHALRKTQIWRFKSHGSQIVLPLFYFIIFFQERDILFSKGIYCCSPIFIFIFFRKNLNKAGIKLYERKGAFWQNTHSATWKVICASFERCVFEVLLEPWFTSSMNLASGLPICLKSLLQGLVRKIYTMPMKVLTLMDH